jgi:hypothetical protein
MIVTVAAPVIVAVHVNGNPTVDVHVPSDHVHGSVPVQVHGYGQGAVNDHVNGHGR